MNAPPLFAPRDTRDAPILELEDSWEAINEYFLVNDLTDGLPIVPPTEARVALMTAYVERQLGYKPADVIGTLAPKQGQATIEKIAANVVMGGAGTHSLSVQTRLASENVTVPILRKDGTPWHPAS